MGHPLRDICWLAEGSDEPITKAVWGTAHDHCWRVRLSQLPEAGKTMGDAPRPVQGFVRESAECAVRLTPVVELPRGKRVEVQMEPMAVVRQEMLIVVLPSVSEYPVNQSSQYSHEGPGVICGVVAAESFVPTRDILDAVLLWDLVGRLIWDGRTKFDPDSPNAALWVPSIAAVQRINRHLPELLFYGPWTHCIASLRMGCPVSVSDWSLQLPNATLSGRRASIASPRSVGA
jgi:hypothetical protein